MSSVTGKILIVEDSALIARTLSSQIQRSIPNVETSCVTDGENAYQALTGKKYEEFDPHSNTTRHKDQTSFVAAIWDNTLPEKKGGSPEKNVGLRTVEKLKESKDVDPAILKRFISHSSDSPEPLKKSNNYVEVFVKPMSHAQVTQLGKLYHEWNPSSRKV